MPLVVRNAIVLGSRTRNPKAGEWIDNEQDVSAYEVGDFRDARLRFDMGHPWATHT
jgi:hypothetical protein